MPCVLYRVVNYILTLTQNSPNILIFAVWIFSIPFEVILLQKRKKKALLRYLYTLSFP